MTGLTPALQSIASDPRWPVAALLVLGCGISLARLSTRHSSGTSLAARAAHFGLTLVAALALWACLFPPATMHSLAVDALTVLTPGTTSEQIAALPTDSNVVALPGVVAARGIQPVVDLAQALRLHPEARPLHIVGGGLPARDRDAARGRPLAFDPAPTPQGILATEIPDQLRPGQAWQLHGLVNAPAGSTLELLDPASSPVADSAPDAQGRFDLGVINRVEGGTLFLLQLKDADGQLLDQQPIPVVTRATPALRMLLLAATPDAELKYLRRWAEAAGITLSQRIGLSRDITFGGEPVPFTADALAGFDVVMLDERIWAGLDASEKSALIDALRAGLGLLLRISGRPDDSVLSDLSALGFPLQVNADDDGSAVDISLDRALGLKQSGIRFGHQPIFMHSADATSLLAADDGTKMAVVGNLGVGRMALWWLTDSYRLVLNGERERHASLWANALQQIARARGGAQPQIPARIEVDQRAVFCQLDSDAVIVDPQGQTQTLVIDADTNGCAGFWPREPGWHRLQSNDQSWPFHVAPFDPTSALTLYDNARATEMLGSAVSAVIHSNVRVALPRWPFFMLFVLLAAGLWWIERRRIFAT